MKNYQILQDAEYFGIDASNEISLFEYGMLCQYHGTGEYEFILQVSDDQFCRTNFHAGELRNLLSENWITDELSNFAGYDFKETDFTNPLDVLNFVHDLISYYGVMEISGSYYSTFEAFLQMEDGTIYGCNDQVFESLEAFENSYFETENS